MKLLIRPHHTPMNGETEDISLQNSISYTQHDISPTNSSSLTTSHSDSIEDMINSFLSRERLTFETNHQFAGIAKLHIGTHNVRSMQNNTQPTLLGCIKFMRTHD